MTVQRSSPLIMGVLNVTPDSFADSGQYLNLDKAIAYAKSMIKQGADIIDIGGESTRPNADLVSTNDEIKRVIPVVEALYNTVNAPISIDTSKPEVMSLALAAGASMINDVCALQNDGALEIAASYNIDVCLIHMQGNPKDMQSNPTYTDVLGDISRFFAERIQACVCAGIDEHKIILDPGFGFGKTLAHNIEILQHLDVFKSFGLRILAGLSRKSMIGDLLDNRPIKGRLVGSVAAAMIAVQNGADIVRVHDVLATKDALTILRGVS